MKYFIVFVAVIGLALASQKPINTDEAQLEAIIAAIQNPNTDPATAALLEQQLQEILAAFVDPEQIAVGPALVDTFEPIAIGPPIIDSFEPISVGPALVDNEDVLASAASSPLVQIILNIKQSSPDASPVVVAPPTLVVPDLVTVVDESPVPVEVVEEAPEPVQIVEDAPESVNVAPPIIVAPVITPDDLN